MTDRAAQYTMTIPARRGFIIGLRFIMAAIICLFTQEPTITIDFGITFNEGRPL